MASVECLLLLKLRISDLFLEKLLKAVEMVILIFLFAVGEAKNLGPVSGPNRLRDLCTFCTINLDQEEVFRTKVFDKSIR